MLLTPNLGGADQLAQTWLEEATEMARMLQVVGWRQTKERLVLFEYWSILQATSAAACGCNDISESKDTKKCRSFLHMCSFSHLQKRTARFTATNFFWTIKKGHQSLQTPDEAGVDERRWPQTRLPRTFSLKDLSRLSIQKGSIERPKRTEEAPQGHKKKPRPALPVLKDSGRKTANLHLHWWSTTGRWRIKLPRFPASRVIHGEDIEGGHLMHLQYGRRIRA